MYQFIAKQKVRQGFQQISQADFAPLLEQFAPDIHFTFAGDHAMAGNFHTREAVHQWFDRVHHLFPDLQLVPDRIFVAGPPWDMVVTTQWHVSASLLDGTPYKNNGIQVLRIRWGKVVEDHLIEDTQLLVGVLQRLAGQGMTEASAPPISG